MEKSNMLLFDRLFLLYVAAFKCQGRSVLKEERQYDMRTWMYRFRFPDRVVGHEMKRGVRMNLGKSRLS